MTILVDMDDTISGLLPVWIEELNRESGLHLQPDDVTEWNLRYAYPTLTIEQIYAPLYQESTWERVKPLPGAVDSLRELIKEGHDVYIVTAAHYRTVGMKCRNVLAKYFPFISYKNVIMASNKQMIKGDILVDDNPLNLLCGDYKGILMDAPHNQGFDAEGHGIYRVADWKACILLIHFIYMETYIK